MIKSIQYAHMRTAANYGMLSKAVRRKVGCVIVKDDTIIAIGYNGTPAGWDNCCEGENGQTLPEVVHAEQNALDKLMRTNAVSVGAELYTTVAPCFECAKRILGARISAVYYRGDYKNTDGLKLLERGNIPTIRLDDAAY